MPLEKLAFRPGMTKAYSDFASEGGWVDGDKVRFVAGIPEKIGGWEKILSTAFVGKCRGILAWQDFSQAKRIAIGTHKKAYYYYAGGFVDITPIRASGTLTGPFTTVSGSDVVEVADTAHGLTTGDYASYSGASAVGGITIDGEYVVTTTSANTYNITHSSAATSSATGGGSVDYEYQITIGRDDAVQAFGWGVGTWGDGTWGTPRSTSITLNSRTWSLSQWGENLLLMPRRGNLYEWDPDTGGRAVIVSNAPTNNTAMFVTVERHVVLLGANGDLMNVAWSDAGQNTSWTPAASNQAGSIRLEGGSQLLRGTPLRSGVNILWSDTDAFVMQFTGDQLVFSQRKVGDNNGIIGPNAFATDDGRAYWMSDGRFLMYDGYVQEMPRSLDIRDYVFQDINKDQRDKITCGVNEGYSEIWWFYPSSGSTEIDRYVSYNKIEQHWCFGTLERTAFAPASIFGYPVATDGSGYLYRHETGADADGSAMDASITSAPMDIADGAVSMDVFTVIPDFDTVSGTLDFYILTRDKPAGALTTDGPYEITSSTTEVDVRVAGRQAAVKIGSNEVGGDFRLGMCRIEAQPSGRRR